MRDSSLQTFKDQCAEPAHIQYVYSMMQCVLTYVQHACICMHGCMDAWMHGCMDAWMHGCMDAWMHAV